MFDPTSIGRIESKDIEVIKVLPSKRLQSFEAIITLQKHKHHVIFKPNLGGKRDQVVADRLKYLFRLQPMYTVAAILDFFFQANERVEKEINYFMFAYLGEAQSIEHLNFSEQSDDFKVEVFKILMFRFIIGCSNSSIDHIVMINSQLVSISEMKVSSAPIPAKLVSRFINAEANSELLERARHEVTADFDHDNMRGIIVMSRRPEKSLYRMKPKGPLTVPAVRIATLIEERVHIIATCNLENLFIILTVLR